MSRQTKAIIDLQALKRNLNRLKALAPASKTLAVVKANAYGNGVQKVSETIQSDVDMFAVAISEEAVALRQGGIEKPILVLQGPHQASEISDYRALHFTWMIHNTTQLDWVEKAFEKDARVANQLWFKFDSGMHRLGFALNEFSTLRAKHPHFFNKHTVVATHLACADEPDKPNTSIQLARFFDTVGSSGLSLSIANSAAHIANVNARQSYNRIGIAMYGSSPFEDPNPSAQPTLDLSPVMHLYASIIALRKIPKGDSVGYGASWQAKRDTIIATVAIGYADGYPRHAPSGTPAFYKNQRIELVGRVSMDMVTFDVTDVPDAALYDEVELWGANVGINEVAAKVGTIGYELMTRVSPRVPRQYQ
uniref:alanine racemase n=1 Tax=Ningiella ruwaisensis TaxID=2364274 RepID=UPI00109F9670|nr:alanine racemase [Ningiella ruwaisensis]